MALQEEDETFFIPLSQQKAFGGAGIKRKRIQFVPESGPQEQELSSASENKQSLEDVYLSIVLRKSRKDQSSSREESPDETQSSQAIHSAKNAVVARPQHDKSSSEAFEPNTAEQKTISCPVCGLPLPSTAETSTGPHEANLAHQIHLSHSHPPSALDRRRKGFTYLSSYGWDPDSQTGLGASGREGRLYPVKAQMRDDNRGIGAAATAVQESKQREKTPEKLDAKKIRKLQDEEKKRQKRLNDLVHGRDDVNKYLGIEL